MLSDEQQIRNLIYRVADLRDRGDFHGAAQLFGNATFQTHYPAGYPGVGVPVEEVASRQPGTHGRQRGVEETEELFRRTTRVYEGGLPHTHYATTNLQLQIDDDTGTAEARSYYVVFQSRPDFPLQPVCAGRYHDVFERIDGAWAFRSRDIFADHSGDLSHHLAMDPLAYGASFAQQRGAPQTDA